MRGTKVNRMCRKKMAHPYKDLAEQHRQRLVNLPNSIAPECLEVYCCLHCWRWHVGYRPRQELKS
jgi:hypothetical protein